MRNGSSRVAPSAAATSTGKPSRPSSKTNPATSASSAGAAKPPRRHGKPATIIDLKELAKLAAMQCSYDEIAAWFGCGTTTIDRRIAEDKTFKAIIEDGRAKGRIGVRRAQYQAAMDGDRTMLIWLGKQYLAQREPRQEVTTEISGKGGAPIQVEVKHLSDEQLEQIIIKGIPEILVSLN